MRKYAVALAFLLVVSGCGGSSGTATPVTTVGSAATQAPTTTAIPTTTPVPTTVPLGACYWELREEETRKKASTGLVLDGEPIDCSYQNLGNVDLSDHTRLPKVDFEGANLSGADLSGAWFGGAILEEVCFDSSTHWPSPWFSPPTNNCSSNESGVVAVDFWPVVDETTCVSPGTGVMNCLVGIGDYAGQPVNCLSLGVMGWRCIAYVPD